MVVAVCVHFHGVALLVVLVAMVFVSCSTCLLQKVLAMALLCCREEPYTDERAKVRGEAGKSFELIGLPKSCRRDYVKLSNVKHCVDFSFLFSAPLPPSRNLLAASGIFCGGRYQPGCPGIFLPAEGTSQPITVSQK